MNKKIVHDALILFAFTVVLGLMLALVYGITKEPIAKVNYEKTQAAYKQVFSDADSFEPYAEFSPEDAAQLMTEGGYEDQIMDVQVAKDASGNALGYVITVTAKDASQAPITFSVGIRNNDAGDGYLINGYSITSIAETPGLGMKATEEKFAGQFANSKVTDYYQVVKSAPSAAN